MKCPSLFLPGLVFFSLAQLLHAEAPAKLELKKGEHISIVGNSLADRMQNDGTLEALILKARPQDDLSIRNLGFSADEFDKHMRSDEVASQDEWLAKTKADVVLAFWGFNESFAGYDGLAAFKSGLEKYIKAMQTAKYNGQSAPRLVLFSPIAQEKGTDPNWPDPTANNTNLLNYTNAMAEVAKANNVQFIDLFTPSQALFKAAKEPLTVNGIHLTTAGYQVLAPVIYKGLFGTEAPAVEPAVLEKIRAAVHEQNKMWLSRYRTVDQYNIYGGRSIIGYVSGPNGPKVDNRAVLWPEMAVRDVMTENREKRVWALAKGNDLKVDDSNVPAVPKIGTNKPGPNADGSYPFISGEEAIKLMTVPKGVKIELVADEAKFPELVSPVQMAFDPKGRLWISAWKNYPERTPWSTDGDKLLIFDLGADGKATKCTTFLDDLNCPTGFQFYKDGVVVMESPFLWFVRDKKGNGKGELVERLLGGLDAADSHHETNSMVIEPGGGIYLSDGVFHRTQVETASGPVRNQDGGIYRWEPRTGKFERYVAYQFANPHGRVFDYWGNDIITDATGNANYFAPAFSGHIDGAKHPAMEQFWKRPSRPCPGTGLLSSRAWPAEFQNNFLNCNVIGIQGIFRVKVTEEGSGLHGETLENLITSTDPNFRPSGITVAPDGSLYFMDWHKPLIGHLQHHLRDPNREMEHGRIYRLTFEGQPLLKPAKISGETVPKLLDLLKEPENNVRDRAKIELSMHDTQEVMAALDQWVAALDPKEPTYEHNVLEALWVKQYQNVVDAKLLERVLKSPEPRARAQGVRVLGYWRDRLNHPLEAVKIAANDENPRVRLEALRVASFFGPTDAREALLAAFDVLNHDTDYYIDYCYKETYKQLKSMVEEPLLPTDPRGLVNVLKGMTDDQLTKAPGTEPVLLARLERKSLAAGLRQKAVTDLAVLHKTDVTTELVAGLKFLDGRDAGSTAAADDLARYLSVTPVKDLLSVRPALATLAASAKMEAVRRASWVALVSADSNPATTWAEAKSDAARFSLIDGLGYVVDPGLRVKFQGLLVSTLNDAKTADATRQAALKSLPLMGPENAAANFTTLAAFLQKGVDRPTAARALMQLPREAWNKEAAGPLTESLLAYAKTVPASDRTAQDFVEIVQAGNQLANLLSETEAARLHKEFRTLGVSVYVIKTVREQMRYDTPRLVVEAGKPFEIIFENMDAMAHNLVVVEPGTRQSVAESVQTQRPDKMDRHGRAYVPEKTHDVLDATKLIEPGQKDTLKIIAPVKEGNYEYVCTFPGHWPIMWGTLVVTNDVDAYLQAHPIAAPTGPTAALPAHQH